MKQELPTIPGPIGVFDSGYGGLTILSKIREALPQYDYIYLGDNARTPYGTRSFEIVYEFTLQAVTKLFEMGCHLVILACNTASAKALRSIQINDLPEMDPARRVLGVIRPTVECIGSITQSRHVGVLATAGTIKSESYPLEIHKLFPDIQVAGEACPLWVSLAFICVAFRIATIPDCFQPSCCGRIFNTNQVACPIGACIFHLKGIVTGHHLLCYNIYLSISFPISPIVRGGISH